MTTTTRLVGLLTVAAAVAAGCSGGGDTAAVATSVPVTATTLPPTTTVAPTTTTTTVAPTTTTTFPTDVPRMTLTGEPIADAAVVPDRPALAVKISNYPSSVLPQAGLNSADIVFHEIINDGASRLAVVFHSQQADPVGPVRSGRSQDIDLLLSLNRPLYAWSGGNPSVTKAVAESDLIDLSALRTPGYYRRSGRTSPNNVYASTDVLWGRTPADATAPQPVFSYLPVDEAVGGDPATDITIRLDIITSRWRYDAETNGYYRWQNGVEHDTETGAGTEQVWTSNVVVMMVDYGVDPADGNPDAQVLGSNPVYVFSGGTVRVGTWVRFAATDPFNLVDNVDDQNPIGLLPGRTWVEIPRNRDGVLDWS